MPFQYFTLVQDHTRTTQGPHRPTTHLLTNKIYLSIVPPGCLRLDRSRETESETQVLSSKYDAV